jgi:NodT family efflux transporter outer membrane factor (OMF) lipoprotein
VKYLYYTFTVLLGSCALYGPNYQKPQIDVSSNWSESNSIIINKESVFLSNVAWWGKFQDKQLNYLIESTLDNNANIQQAIGNIIQAQGNLKQVNLALIPTISANSSYSSTVNLNANSTTNSGTVIGTSFVPSGEWYSLGLVPLYSLNLFQQLRMMDSAKAGLLATIYAKDFTRLTVISQIIAAYFTLYAQYYQLSVSRELFLDLEKQLQIANLQYNLGYISLFNLQDIKSKYYNVKAQIPIMEKNIVFSQNTIKVLLNEKQESIIFNNSFKDLKVLDIVPTIMVSDVLKNRPDVLQAEANLIQANAGIGVATSNYFPTFRFNGGIGTSSTSNSGLFSVGRDFWQQQIQLTFPFLNLSTLGAIKGAKGIYYSAYYNYVMTVRQAYSDADNAVTNYYKTAEYYKDIQQQLQANEISYNISRLQYKEGLISYYNMLSNKINFDNMKIMYANSKLQHIQAIISLYQAMGGGYAVNNQIKIKKFGDAHDL